MWIKQVCFVLVQTGNKCLWSDKYQQKVRIMHSVLLYETCYQFDRCLMQFGVDLEK